MTRPASVSVLTDSGKHTIGIVLSILQSQGVTYQVQSLPFIESKPSRIDCVHASSRSLPEGAAITTFCISKVAARISGVHSRRAVFGREVRVADCRVISFLIVI